MNVRQVIPRDAIPSVDDPEFGPEYFGDPDDEVIVVEGPDGRRVRAYPIPILNYHEIVNDDFEGDSIAVTWCPLCGSAVVYDREVGGRVLEFGVSGKLADDDLVMYDRETGSEWKQSLGEAIAGDLEGESLTVRSSGVTTYAAFRDQYPGGEVLQRPGGVSEASGAGDDPEPIDYDDAPYADYFDSDGFGLDAHRGSGGREWDRDDLDPKTAVLGIEAEGDDGDALGFPLPRVERAGGVAHATVGAGATVDADGAEGPNADVGPDEGTSASEAACASGRASGREVVVFATPDGFHAFENPGFEFEAASDDEGTFEADGATWDGATGESDDGRTLERVPARRLFAFAWQDDHGEDAFWSAD